MTLTAQNLVAWHDRDTANHVAERDKFAEKGFRPLSLSIYGTPNDPRFAAVMVKRDQVIATRSVINKTQSEYQKVFEDMAEEGFGPFIITATGPKNSAIFASSFRKMSNIPLTRSNLSKDEFIELNAQQNDARPRSRRWSWIHSGKHVRAAHARSPAISCLTRPAIT